MNSLKSKLSGGFGGLAQESKQWAVSIVVHGLILLILFMFNMNVQSPPKVASVISELEDIVEEDIPEELTPDDEIDLDAEVSLSPAAGDGAVGESIAGLVNPLEASMQTAAVHQAISDRSLNRPLQAASVSMGLGENVSGLKGGFEFTGGNGDAGVVDRITQEIIRQVNKNKVVVAWVMDSSGSMQVRREAIAKRFDRIYKELDELGVNESGALLTAIVSVGERTKFMLDKPTAEIAEIRKAINDIKDDDTGVENIFTGIRETALKYRSLQTSGRRTLMLILLTDEIGYDTEIGDETTALLKRYQVPLYVMGPMATFNRPTIHDRQTIKDETGKEWDFWIPLRRGPFTRVEEQLRVPFNSLTYEAGFGPFHLTKITRETGGIFFVTTDDPFLEVATRGTRNSLPAPYEPEILLQYKANYGSPQDYAAEIAKTSFRKALMGIIEEGNKIWSVDFPHSWINASVWEQDLQRRQRQIAPFIDYANRAIPALDSLEKEYDKETDLRWRANFLLTQARILQAKVRADEYMWALANFRQNPLRLKDPAKNNAWRYALDNKLRIGFKPGVDISTPEKLKEAKVTETKLLEDAKAMLEKADALYDRTAKEHEGTPWAHAAIREKSRNVGVHFVEDFNRNHAITPEEAKRREEARKQIKKL